MESLITFQGFHQATVDGVRPEADHLTSDVIPLSTLALVLHVPFQRPVLPFQRPGQHHWDQA
jgi:hypothetical protein